MAARPAADRVVRAYNNLREFVQRYYGGRVEIALVEVDVGDFPGAVCEIRRRVLENAGGDVVVNLSGGPRALVLATYAAVQLLPDGMARRVRVEVEFEDGTSWRYHCAQCMPKNSPRGSAKRNSPSWRSWPRGEGRRRRSWRRRQTSIPPL